MRELGRRREALEGELSPVKSPAPRLHPTWREIYRRKVATLHDRSPPVTATTAESDPRPVDAIVLVPDYGVLRIEVRAILRDLGAGLPNAVPYRYADALCQRSCWRGRILKPATFRLWFVGQALRTRLCWQRRWIALWPEPQLISLFRCARGPCPRRSPRLLPYWRSGPEQVS